MRVVRGGGSPKVSLLAGLLSFVPLDAGAEEDTVVAVFPVSTVNLDAGEVLRQSMWAYIEARIAESPGYRVVPHGALEAAIRARHQAYLSQRYDPETQAEVGRQVAASKTVTTRIIRLVDLCKVSVTVFDIARQVSTEAAGAEGPCHERALGESLRVALDELVDGPAPVASAPPLPASTPAAVVLDEGSSAAQPEGEGEPGSLTVGIQPWGGYVGGPYFNGGLTPSEASRFRSDYGLEVRFELLKSIPDSVRAWRAGEVDVLWITVDDLPTEYPQLQPLRPVLFMLTGWSRGEEQLVVRKDIQTLNDLKGKRVALEPKTPAHSFLLISLDLAGLDYDDVTIVSARSSRDAADRFIRGDADAAMVWVDEKEDCLGEVPGAFVLESTKDASFLIAESLVVKAEVLRRNGQALRALAEGWLRANAEINANANGARRRAIEIIESFGKSRRIAEEELRTVRLATHGDNINFFGLNPRYRGEKGQDLFDYFWTRYAAVMPGVMAKPSWGAIADPALVRGLSLRGRQHQPEPMHDFAYCQNPEHQRSLSRKSLQVTFPTNGAKLDEAAKRDIEEKFGHLAEIYFEDCIRLSGNTDSTGRRAYNLELSLKRAEAVKRYLVRRYGFDPRRIITVGHGPDEPVDSNATEAGRARNRRTDFELLH